MAWATAFSVMPLQRIWGTGGWGCDYQQCQCHDQCIMTVHNTYPLCNLGNDVLQSQSRTGIRTTMLATDRASFLSWSTWGSYGLSKCQTCALTPPGNGTTLPVHKLLQASPCHVSHNSTLHHSETWSRMRSGATYHPLGIAVTAPQLCSLRIFHLIWCDTPISTNFTLPFLIIPDHNHHQSLLIWSWTSCRACMMPVSGYSMVFPWQKNTTTLIHMPFALSHLSQSIASPVSPCHSLLGTSQEVSVHYVI